jgi:glycerophosphoryl diester phosphodiesterase
MPRKRPFPRSFTLIAHRGSSYDAPENTFDAFDLALQNGFTNMETDVQLTADGVLVLIHDDTLDRTTSGKGKVAEVGIAYVKSLDAGLWFEGPKDGAGRKGPASYGESFVPTLEEFLDRYHGKVGLHLELKSHEPELAPKVAALLEEYGWERPETPGGAGVTISSFDIEQLRRSKPLLPDLDHGHLLREITPEACETAKSAGCTGIYPHAATVEAADIELARRHGLIVRTWGVKSEADLRRAFDAGALGTTVDWPVRAKRVLGL